MRAEAELLATVPPDSVEALLEATDARLATEARFAADADCLVAAAEDERVAAAVDVRLAGLAEVRVAAPDAALVDTPERVVPGERRLAPPVTVPLAIFLSREPHE